MIHSRFSPGIAASVGALLLCFSQTTFAAYGAAAPKGVDLSGNWQINAARSDDAEALLQERLDELRTQHERWMRDARRTDPLGIPPLGMPLPPPEDDARKAPPPDPSQKRKPRPNDNLRRMLNISDTLVITQAGATIDIRSQLDTRRFEAGSQSQVSMPQGELADSSIGWDGQWFVIDRKARKGPRVTERYRWLPKTDQLESEIKWGGDTLLSGIKVHRIYDRMTSAPPAPDPEAGPVR
ncbi:MAG TPA: hypothetical protein PKE27_05520 [Povalibacter sp.]|uniref:hypothetical protein n=1 Tax=Povalibacter sp. TaxID=1962978 RepID=UPI002C129C9A|nr:hypothetical protein [Povalibacter sp.]HMN44008.1 hypothetical protein [Povalibacter sp.]